MCKRVEGCVYGESSFGRYYAVDCEPKHGAHAQGINDQDEESEQEEPEKSAVAGWRGLGCCCCGFHSGTKRLPGHAPGVSEVPFVEAVDGWKTVVGESDGSVEGVEGWWKRAFPRSQVFQDGTRAECVEKYGDGEVGPPCGEGEAVGTVQWGRRGFAGDSHRGVHGGNVALFMGCGKGCGLFHADYRYESPPLTPALSPSDGERGLNLLGGVPGVARCALTPGYFPAPRRGAQSA